MASKLWDGRFAEETDQLMEAFSSSIDYDKRLYAYDIKGSKAHARMLGEKGIIGKNDAEKIIEGLDNIEKEFEKGEFKTDDALEDVHMHIEARLFELIGDTAKKLHTARSRNDQVAVDVRMFLRHESLMVMAALLDARKAFIALASAYPDIVMPGYTHMQRAQPVLFAHHLMAYQEMFKRDFARIKDGLARINISPLGCLALAGTAHPIDRDMTARELLFDEVCANSMDGISDRDFIMEFQAAAAIIMVHLSRFSEELILWSTSEFGFVELPDAFSTGSSIMPQKKNPDSAELIRGKSGRVIGNLMSILALMKGLPMSYNRDMQEDKEPLFDTVDTVKMCLAVTARMVPRLAPRKTVMKQAASKGFQDATDLADYLVEKGVPFRQAHEIVGKTVAFAVQNGCELSDLTLDTLKTFSSLVEEDVFDRITVKSLVERRTSKGGTAFANVAEAMDKARQGIDEDEKNLSTLLRKYGSQKLPGSGENE